MKTNFKIVITTVITIFSLISCESYIEVDVPQSQLTGQAVFEDASTATAALSNVYARLRGEGMVTGSAFGLSNFMGNYADELTFYGNNTVLQSINNHTIVPSNSYIATLWNTSYGQLYALNAIVEGVTNSNNISAEDKNKLMGEALFLRAYIHFYLVNCFSEIPYIKTTNYIQNTTVSKNTISEVNQNILNDLTDAEALLLDNYPTNERVRANKFVVKAMLARMHLYLQNWEQAETYATEVINNASYNWELNIQNVFLKENPGIIWALHRV